MLASRLRQSLSTSISSGNAIYLGSLFLNGLRSTNFSTARQGAPRYQAALRLLSTILSAGALLLDSPQSRLRSERLLPRLWVLSFYSSLRSF
jgi:hypothetical protein